MIRPVGGSQGPQGVPSRKLVATSGVITFRVQKTLAKQTKNRADQSLNGRVELINEGTPQGGVSTRATTKSIKVASTLFRKISANSYTVKRK